MNKYYTIVVFTALALIAGCGSTPNAGVIFNLFAPSHAIYSTFVYSEGGVDNVIGSILFSSDSNACTKGVTEQSQYLEISLTAKDAGKAAASFVDEAYPISSTPVMVDSNSKFLNAVGTFNPNGSKENVLLVDSTSQSHGSVKIEGLPGDMVDVSYDITIPGVGQNSATVKALYCKEYGLRIQQIVDAPLLQPG